MRVLTSVLSVVVGVVVMWTGGCGAQERPVVDVAEGRVLGLNTTRNNITFLEFLSIPYAQPPVGALRFKDPQPAQKWEGNLDASELPQPCDQLTVLGSEDCLYLNVYTPEYALVIDYPIPVMVYVHGGGFIIGSSNKLDGFEGLVDEGVIVVQMQYRLGIFGFLSTEDEEASGNQGLKDQNLALTWVQNNIAAFGGDPDKVTLFGGSAGSASIHYHILAPSSAGLFSAAIMQSGSSLCPWGSGRDFLWAAQRIAERFNCPTEPSDSLVTCLQTVPGHLLDSSYASLIKWNIQPFYFAPRVDGEFLPDNPVTLMKEGRYHHVPTIMGVARDELSLETIEMYAAPELIHSLVSNFSINGPVSLELYEDEDPLNTATTVYNHYLGGINITKEDSDNLTRMYTEGLFLVRYDWTVELMSDQTPVFAYELHHRGEYGFTNKFLDNGLDLPQAYNYISHGDDKQYTLYPRHADLHTPEDIAVGQIFITMWTNFAKTGNPTPDDSLGFVWELSDSVSLQHLKIIPQPVMEADQRTEARAFWESLPLRINDLLNA